MRIYIMRHAQADDNFSGDDFDKPLIEKGRVTERQMAELIKGQGANITKIISSPLLRAQQTSAVIVEVFPKAFIEPEPALSNDFDEEKVLESIIRSMESELAVVGHSPNLGYLAMHLIDGNQDLSNLAKSSVVAIEFDDKPAWKKGRLLAYHKPS